MSGQPDMLHHARILRAVADLAAEAEGDGQAPLCIAVCDAVGDLLHYTRMAGAKRRGTPIAQAKAYTAVTMGTVIDHRFMGEGRMNPVLEYTVDGTQYRAKKQFRGIKTKSLSGLPIRTQATAYEDAKGWLHVQTGPIARLGTLAEQLWPLGSQMTVYYNPSNPDKSYVERPIVGNFATLMFNIAGFLLIAMSILLYVLIQR